jgi:predicted neutral ceramidase superfamily lipid hydrolase
LRIDHVLILTDVAFFTLTIFFSGLTIQVADPSLRMQLVALSSSFFVGGVVIVIASVLLYILKKGLHNKREP